MEGEENKHKGKFQKGNPGKPKGATNLITRSVKEHVLDAFIKLQDHPTANLLSFGESNPALFYQIAAKLIPTEVQAKFEGRIIRVLPPEKK